MTADNSVLITAGLVAALPFVAEIDHLRQSQREDLRLRLKYPDQIVHLVVPRMHDLKRIVTEKGEEGKLDSIFSRFLCFSTESNCDIFRKQLAFAYHRAAVARRLDGIRSGGHLTVSVRSAGP